MGGDVGGAGDYRVSRNIATATRAGGVACCAAAAKAAAAAGVAGDGKRSGGRWQAKRAFMAYGGREWRLCCCVDGDGDWRWWRSLRAAAVSGAAGVFDQVAER